MVLGEEMPTFYARKRTKGKVPISFSTASGRVSFGGHRLSKRRTKIDF
jgi:hypothetical protein